ncbi:MAG: hypothetical protein L0211_16200 [Planctomycetaceae bacterium]|nr:hypothetical protein [Planctomycetaceae bacterium]
MRAARASAGRSPTHVHGVPCRRVKGIGARKEIVRVKAIDVRKQIVRVKETGVRKLIVRVKAIDVRKEVVRKLVKVTDREKGTRRVKMTGRATAVGLDSVLALGRPDLVAAALVFPGLEHLDSGRRAVGRALAPKEDRVKATVEVEERAGTGRIGTTTGDPGMTGAKTASHAAKTKPENKLD